MRFGLFAIGLCFVAAPVAFSEEIGAQWNDSNTIQLPGGPDTYPGDTSDPASNPESGAGGGESEGSANGGAPPSGGSSGSGGGSSGESDVIIFTNPDSESGSSSGFSGALGDGGGGDSGPLIELLAAEGGVSGEGGAALGAEGSDGVFINAAKVRAALKGKGVLRVTLRAFGERGGALSTSDFALVGASSALKNPAMESAFISLSRFAIAYRSQGYLFAVVPLSFTVRISVNPRAEALRDRVEVRFPWYSFFLRKFVSRDGLARDIHDILTRDFDPSLEPSEAQARLFTDVSVMLQNRADTFEESVTGLP